MLRWSATFNRRRLDAKAKKSINQFFFKNLVSFARLQNFVFYNQLAVCNLRRKRSSCLCYLGIRRKARDVS